MSSCGCVLFAIKKIFLPCTHTKTSCETVLTVIDLCPLGPIKEDLEALTEGSVSLNPIPPAQILFRSFKICSKFASKPFPLEKNISKQTNNCSESNHIHQPKNHEKPSFIHFCTPQKVNVLAKTDFINFQIHGFSSLQVRRILLCKQW